MMVAFQRSDGVPEDAPLTEYQGMFTKAEMIKV